jgi:hypothetical protein
MATGLVAGFGIPCLPFFLAAPHSFVHDVIGDQISRTTVGSSSLPVDSRLVLLSGLHGLTVLHAGVGLALLLALIFVGLVGFGYGLAWRNVSRFDLLILGCALTTTVAMFRARDMYDHYAYFPAVFYVLLVAVCISRILDRGAVAQGWSWLARPAVPVAFAVAVAALAVPDQVHYAKTYLAGAFDPSAVLDLVIPKGACVVADQSTDAIVANRFVADKPCPSVVDPYGTWLATYEAHLPPYYGPVPASFVARWRTWLGEADYVIEIGPQSDILPWPPSQVAWFNSRFTQVYRQPGMAVYRSAVPAG